MAESPEGKVALVTGASRGIGLAIACDLSYAGWRVVGTARASDALEHLSEILSRGVQPGIAIAADLRDEKSVENLFARIDEQFGQVDALINNAGITRSEPFLETTPEAWRAVLSTNLDAVFLVTQQAVCRMLQRRSGHVVFIASDAAIRGIARMAPYCASKHAILGFARSLQVELAKSGIRITTIMPGPVNTTILRSEANRLDLPQPEDIAASVHYALALPARAEVREILVVPSSS